ncbi:hypothetical protein GDO78_016420, partial [Eleutherodactylus coqui]
MTEEITDILTHALENIGKESLQKFKRKLSSIDVQPQYQKIPSSLLDEKSAKDVVDCIIRYYTIKNGPDITVQVLQDINERQVSVDLKESIQRVREKSVNVEEKTPRKGLAYRLRDRTNRMSSSPLGRPRRKRRYRKENSSESSEDYFHSQTKQSKAVKS